MSDIRWGYASSRDAESWSGACLTREDAILEGKAHYRGYAFWIHSGHVPPVDLLLPDVDDIVERMTDSACDEAGEAAEEYPDLSEEAKGELAALLLAWGEKYAKPNFWVADGEGEHIPEDPVRVPATPEGAREGGE